MPPVQVHAYSKKQSRALPPDPQEIAHLAVLAADTIETLPPSLTRSLSDLKELDAVLNTSLISITQKLVKLLNMIEDPTAVPADRLALLKEVADDAATFKLGGEDKIRVATGTCETIGLHAKQLDLITSLMTSLMPFHVLETIPASATPNGYPHLFPSYGSSTATSLYRPRSDFFPPAYAGPLGGSNQGSTRASRESYRAALDAVTRYQGEGPLPVMGSAVNASRSRERVQQVQAKRTAPAPATAPRARTISQSAAYAGNATHTVGGIGPDQSLLHEETADLHDAPSPAPPAKKPRRATEKSTAVAPVANQWDAGGAMDYEMGSPVDSPLPTGTTARTASKRPRSSQPAMGGNGGAISANSPTERPPSTSSTRRRVPAKKLSPAPPAARPAPAAARRRTTLPDELAVDPALQPERTTPTGEEVAPVATESEEQSSSIAVSSASVLVAPPLASISLGEPDIPAIVEGEEEPPSQPPSSSAAPFGEPQPGEPVYCTCKRVSFGEMIGCDGDTCPTEWFHLSCVGLASPPKGRWFCDDCLDIQQGPQPKKRRLPPA